MIETALSWAPSVLTVMTVLVALVVMSKASLRSERGLLFDKKEPSTTLPVLIGLTLALALTLTVLTITRTPHQPV